jgi:glycosyltransferase involved in cell wall biosynthesis
MITSPSLDTSKNVGGISNLTHLLIKKNKDIDFTHFIVGKEDSQKRNGKWFFSQFKRLFNFYNTIKENQIEIVHINFPMSELSIIINLLLIVISSQIAKIKTIVHLRGGVLSLNPNIKLYQKKIIKFSLKNASLIFVLGNREKDYINSFYKIAEKNIAVLPNSVEVPDNSFVLDKINRRLKTELPLNVLFIGRIDKNKGLKEIINAFETIKEKGIIIKFYLAGTGHEVFEFTDQCNKIFGKDFNYFGVMNYEEKQKLFEDIDVFLLPSYFEGLPNGLLETMAYGIIPIVTPVGSIPEVVSDDLTGFHVKVRDSESIVLAIERIISDRKLLKSIGSNCYNVIKEKYSISNYIEKINSFYSEVIKQ